MKQEVIFWLGNHFNTTEENIKENLNDGLVNSFLILWSIMEHEIFDVDMKEQDISRVSCKLAKKHTQIAIETEALHFHTRYKNNKDNLRHLLGYKIKNGVKKYNENRKGDYGKKFLDIISKEYDSITAEEKIYLALFVVYRYRNNIFHGAKVFESWKQFTREIHYCIFLMMKIIDSHVDTSF